MRPPLRTRVFARLLTALEGRPVSQTPPDRMPAARARRARLARMPGAGLVVGRRHPRCGVQQHTAKAGDGADLAVHVYRPRDLSGPLPVVVNFHGGGFCTGDAHQSDWWCSHLAVDAGVAVASVDYRLAPEHPFPTAAEDCFAATRWVAEHAERLDVDPGRLAVMGDSAGGNLAAVVSLMARDRGGPDIVLQVLVYPAVDLVEVFPSERENAHAPVLTAQDVVSFSALYRGRSDGSEPYASPLRADHTGLPAAVVQTAEHDPLRDHGRRYAEKLAAAGVPVRHTEYAGAVHGYLSLPGVVPQGRQALAEVVAELRRTMVAVHS